MVFKCAPGSKRKNLPVVGVFFFYPPVVVLGETELLILMISFLFASPGFTASPTPQQPQNSRGLNVDFDSVFGNNTNANTLDATGKCCTPTHTLTFFLSPLAFGKQQTSCTLLPPEGLGDSCEVAGSCRGCGQSKCWTLICLSVRVVYVDYECSVHITNQAFMPHHTESVCPRYDKRLIIQGIHQLVGASGSLSCGQQMRKTFRTVQDVSESEMCGYTL